MKRRKLSCIWLAAAVLFLAGCSSQEEKGMAQVSVITSASEESTSETETENCEETSQAEVTAETETSEVSAALTGPPAIVLTDPLSSAMSSFEVSSGNYSWTMWNDSEAGVDSTVLACGSHPLDGAMEKAEMLDVPSYQKMEKTLYWISCPVLPDRYTLTEWDRDQIGNPEAEPVSESEYETGEMWEAEMEPDKVYRISAVWEESKAQERGFSGEAEYAVLTE